MEKTKKIAIGLGIALAIVIILAIVGYLVIANSTNNKYDKIKANYADSVKQAFNKGFDQGKDAGYSSGYDEGQSNTAELYKDSLSIRDSLLTDCMKGKKSSKNTGKNTANTNKNKNAGKDANKDKNLTTSKDQFNPPQGGADNKNKSGGNASENAKKGAEFGTNTGVGDPNVEFIGNDNPDQNIWISVDKNGYLYYAFRKQYVQSSEQSEFRLNSKNGQKFVLDGDIYRLTTNIKATEITVKNVFRFAILEGEFRGFDSWYPHEILKAVMEAVRGRTDGIITKEELQEMAKMVPEIRSGLVAPNGIYVTTGDGKQYGGWEFRIPVIYTKVSKNR